MASCRAVDRFGRRGLEERDGRARRRHQDRLHERGFRIVRSASLMSDCASSTMPASPNAAAARNRGRSPGTRSRRRSGDHAFDVIGRRMRIAIKGLGPGEVRRVAGGRAAQPAGQRDVDGALIKVPASRRRPSKAAACASADTRSNSRGLLFAQVRWAAAEPSPATRPDLIEEPAGRRRLDAELDGFLGGPPRVGVAAERSRTRRRGSTAETDAPDCDAALPAPRRPLDRIGRCGCRSARARWQV